MATTIYTKDTCPFCAKAKNVLNKLGKPFNEVRVGSDITVEEFKQKFPNATTVPQIILDEEQIGGYDQLVQRVLLTEG